MAYEEENMQSVEEYEMTKSDKEIVEFVTTHCDRWREWRDTNFMVEWDEYERLYYGIWADEDKTRETERSRIVSPAIRQAVDNKVAETLEGMSGNGKFFEIDDDVIDMEKTDVDLMRRLLREDMKKDKITKEIAKVVKIAEMLGTGAAEILVKTEVDRAPATQAVPGQQMAAVGVVETERVAVPIKAIHPRNLLIDPNADEIMDSMGVAVEEYVSLYQVVKGIEDGIYRKCKIEPMYDDTDLEQDQITSTFQDDKVKILRYYGLVPREYLEQLENEGKEVVDLFPEDSAMDQVSDLVEAIIVIANDEHLLKAEKTPYMMQDRPIMAYRPEIVPGRFYGVGTIEKGYNMQKAIDAQLRAHLDSLALTTVPMMGIDATRLPRGMKFEVRPGKNILTNGNPNEILQPFKFGNTDPANYETAKGFEGMLLQATGTLDSAQLTLAAAGAQGGGGVGLSVAMSSIVKKNKMALINFQDEFIVPLVQSIAWRHMQFDPERYPMKDFKFVPVASVGMVAREYEQQQMIGLLQTLGPDSKIVPLVLKGIIGSSSLANRDELVAQLDQMSQPNPQEQQLAMAAQEAQLRLVAAQSTELEARAQESAADAQEAQARAQKLMVEAQLYPKEVEAKIIQGLSANLNGDGKQQEFERRARVAELILKEREIQTKEDIVNRQMRPSQ
jgi:hypothetical protein